VSHAVEEGEEQKEEEGEVAELVEEANTAGHRSSFIFLYDVILLIYQ